MSSTTSNIIKCAVLVTALNGLPSFLQLLDSQLTTGQAYAAEETKKKYKKRRVPSIRARIFAQLERAQKLVDDKKIDEGLAVIEKLKKGIDRMNPYERAQVYNFEAFIRYSQEQFNQAIVLFNKVLEQKPIPRSLEKGTAYGVAQIYMQTEQYDEAISAINRWANIESVEHTSSSLMLLANAYYAKKDYDNSIQFVDQSIETSLADNKLPKESTYVLKRALHFELKQPKQVTQVSENLVRHYSKPKYWVELSNMYGEVGEEAKQLAVLEAAYQQDYIKKESDFINLAQLYYLNGAPFKSAELMESTMASGKIKKNLKNLKFLATTLKVAKEFERAVPVLKEAAQMAKDGEIYASLAETFVSLESWDDAIESCDQALTKGNLKDNGMVFYNKGLAYFGQKKYQQALQQFDQAMKFKKYKKNASQWKSFVNREMRQSRLFAGGI